jgi:3-oxoadipate enol-lactonase
MPHLPLDGFRLHYEVSGSGFPLLLIAGTGSPHTSWLGQIPAYGKHFTCISYDTRGIGESTTEDRKVTIKGLASDALALLNHLEVDRCHVVGTSLGAATAQELCLMSDRVERMVLHAPWDRTFAYPHLARQFQLRIRLIRRGDLQLYEDLSQLWLFSPNHVNASSGDRSGNQEHDKPKSEWDAIVRLFEANLGHDTRGRLDGIDVPTLVTVGDDDFLVHPSYAQTVAEAIPRAQMILWKGVGHLARQEDPATFTEDTLSFLTSS